MNIYLVGFMGSGKSTIGRRLAELLEWTFVDLDHEIEVRERMPIRDIFAERGEAHFRQVEREELTSLGRTDRRVVALGGGAFASAANQEIVAESGRSIWLDAPADVLFARCSGGDSRPLVTTREEFEELLEQRRPMYAQAEFRIDVSRGTVDALARAILALVQPFPH